VRAGASLAAAGVLALMLASCSGSAGSTSRGTPLMKKATSQQRAAARAATNARTLFKSLCAVCHTLAAADAHGDVGPNFDELRPTPAQVRVQVRRTIALSPLKERALIEYVVANAGKGAGKP
jgi:mono/diheme cytochrome c family protein